MQKKWIKCKHEILILHAATHCNNFIKTNHNQYKNLKKTKKTSHQNTLFNIKIYFLLISEYIIIVYR